MAMTLDIAPSAEVAAIRAAEFIAARVADAIRVRGRATIAFSGGSTPAIMLQHLAELPVDWERVDIFQVDERVAPSGDAARNLTQLNDCLLKPVGITMEQVHPMPVEMSDLGLASREYENALRHVAGDPPILDIVHLGMGADGHTASLVPGDSALAVTNTNVAPTGAYQSKRRMTLTFRAINNARIIVWLVCGSDKADALARMVAQDVKIAAGRVKSDDAYLFADASAARLLP